MEEEKLNLERCRIDKMENKILTGGKKNNINER